MSKQVKQNGNSETNESKNNSINNSNKPAKNGHQSTNSKLKFNPMPEIDEDLKYEVPPLEIDANNIDPTRKRRFSVSAEPVNNDSNENFEKKVYPKSESALKRIKHSIKDVFIFKGLDNEQRKLLIDAMFEKRVKKGDEIISQGDRGDYFYVIEKGKYEVWKKPDKIRTLNKNEQKHMEQNGDMKQDNVAKKVFEYDNKGSFGELALMYNSTRAATVKSITKGILWAVDRKTFRHIMLQTNNRKRQRYDKILKDIILLKSITDDQIIAQISDSIESVIFNKNEYIIKQNSDDKDSFYIITKGIVMITINDSDGNEEKVNELKKGDYFGERAILLNDCRSANVIAKSDNVECACIHKETFIRIFQTTIFENKFKKQFMKYKFSSQSNDLSDIED